MGMLRREEGGLVVRLGARSVVGRSAGCTVRLEARGASGEHAVLFWATGRWQVRDLGSTNGTRLDYVEDLLAMLHLDLQHFNVNVFRARQKLARTGVIDAGAVFQRRSTTRQIRLGVDAVEIVTS